MEGLIPILISTILVNNFVLTQFLGLCPFLGVSGQLESAIGMALATTFVLTFSAVFNYLAYHYLLLPFGLEYLNIISFILIIAAFVQFTELVIRTIHPLLHQLLGLFLPLITTNCAVLGVALLSIRSDFSLFETVLYSFGAALGFSWVLILFSILRERIASAPIPAPFQGASINMITAGLMSLAMMGFNGFG